MFTKSNTILITSVVVLIALLILTLANVFASLIRQSKTQPISVIDASVSISESKDVIPLAFRNDFEKYAKFLKNGTVVTSEIGRVRLELKKIRLESALNKGIDEEVGFLIKSDFHMDDNFCLGRSTCIIKLQNDEKTITLDATISKKDGTWQVYLPKNNLKIKDSFFNNYYKMIYSLSTSN